MPKKSKDYSKARFRWMTQRAKLMLYKEESQKELQRLRNKWDIPTQGFKTQSSYLSWREKVINMSIKHHKPLKFDADIYNFLTKIDAPHNYFHHFKSYTLFNTLNEDYTAMGNQPLIFKAIKTNRSLGKGRKSIQKVTIDIYPDTVLEDIIECWSEIQSYQIEMIGYRNNNRQKRMDTLERDLFIYELHLKGFSYKEISKEVKKIYSNGTSLSYADIGTYIKRVKKRIKES